MSNSPLHDRAVDTTCLTARSQLNQRFGTADFGAWTQNLISSLPSGQILDLCCGTGNQLVLYASRSDCKSLIGLDSSTDSLAIAQDRLKALPSVVDTSFVCTELDDAFLHPDLAHSQFDVIECFYGLYYARQPEVVLRAAMERLVEGGAVLIVGPYGANNCSIFELLQRHYTLPDLVIRSATTFMTEEVVPILSSHLNVRKETLVNRVCYPNAGSLIDYWRASTFHSAHHDEAVVKEINNHFNSHDVFVIEKHIMAVVGMGRAA